MDGITETGNYIRHTPLRVYTLVRQRRRYIHIYVMEIDRFGKYFSLLALELVEMYGKLFFNVGAINEN